MRSEWQGDTLVVHFSGTTTVSATLRTQITHEFSSKHSIMKPLSFPDQITRMSFVFHDGKATSRSTTITPESYRSHVAMVVRRVLVNLGLS